MNGSLLQKFYACSFFFLPSGHSKEWEKYYAGNQPPKRDLIR